MAAITQSREVGSGDGSVIKFTWTLTTADPTGVAFQLPEFADINFTMTGTWGGATGALQGSNDNSTWLPLSNAAGGAAATATADKLMTIIERPQYIRPNLTAVGVGASITVTAIARRATPLRT